MELKLSKSSIFKIDDKGVATLRQTPKGKYVELTSAWVMFAVRVSLTCQSYLERKPFTSDTVKMAIGDEIAIYKCDDGSISFQSNGDQIELTVEQMLALREEKEEISSKLS